MCLVGRTLILSRTPVATSLGRVNFGLLSFAVQGGARRGGTRSSHTAGTWALRKFD